MSKCYPHDSVSEQTLRKAGNKSQNELIKADENTFYLFETDKLKDHYTVWERKNDSNKFEQVDSAADPPNTE